MAARFSEVTPNSGVDGDLNPSYQGIVVPLKGANRVMLEDGAELKVKANLPSMVKVKELTSHPPEDLTASQFKSLKSKTLRLFEMPFKQASFPCELTLRRLPGGLTLCRTPIREITKIREGAGHIISDLVLEPGKDALGAIEGELFDVRLVVDATRSTCDELTLRMRGNEVRYDFKRGMLHSALSQVPLTAPSGEIEIRVLLDRLSLETFGSHGAVSITNIVRQKQDAPHLTLTANGGNAMLKKIEVYPLHSIWN